MSSSSGAYIDWFHDYCCGFLVFILTLVAVVLIVLLTRSLMYTKIVEAATLELIWTVFPTTILLLVGFPRLFILYLHEVEDTADLTLKVTGHQ